MMIAHTCEETSAFFRLVRKPSKNMDQQLVTSSHQVFDLLTYTFLLGISVRIAGLYTSPPTIRLSLSCLVIIFSFSCSIYLVFWRRRRKKRGVWSVAFTNAFPRCSHEEHMALSHSVSCPCCCVTSCISLLFFFLLVQDDLLSYSRLLHPIMQVDILIGLRRREYY